MKWKESDFNSGIAAVRALLIYGPDAGMANEFCTTAVKKLGIERDNLFTFGASDFKDKQDYIFAESCSPSMFGGDKMVIITGAGDGDADNIASLVDHPGLFAKVIVTAGDLRPGGLRGLFEDGAGIAALPCYNDDPRTLEAVIRKTLTAAGIERITPDAMQYMIANLGSDRLITVGFLNKIALYVDDKKIVELDDAEKCLPDTGAAQIEDFIYALTLGADIAYTMRALDRLLYDTSKIDAVANQIIYAMGRHFKNLMTAVVDGKVPQLFWKVKDKFMQSIKIWPASEITAVLVRLSELEQQMRTTGMPHEVLLRDFALKLSIHAVKLSKKRRK